MRILFARTPGKIINIPNVGEVRTPFKIDLSRMNNESIIEQLDSKKVFYEIFDDESDSVKIENNQEAKSTTIINQYITNTSNQDNKGLEDKLQNLEQTLKTILSNISDLQINGITIDSEISENKSKKKKEIDIEDEFIPAINLTGTISRRAEVTIEESISSEDFDSIAEQLRNLK